MYVQGASVFCGNSTDPLGTYQQRFSQLSGKRMRRINRFVFLGLIGAFQCIGQRRLTPEAGIYLTTVNGNVGDTEAAMSQLYGAGRLPMPYNFIHTMSNTASFYVSRELGVTGRNITLSAGALSFERGLEAVASDLARGWVNEALVGSVDEASGDSVLCATSPSPPATFRLPNEGSAWLHVSVEKDRAIGKIEAIRSFARRRKAVDWMGGATPAGPACLAFGAGIGPEEREAWRQSAGIKKSFVPKEGIGVFFKGGACALAEFFNCRAAHKSSMIHINRDSAGRYVLTVVRRRGSVG